MKFGIIGAMDVEVAMLQKDMQILRTFTKASMEFCEGTIGGAAVVVGMEVVVGYPAAGAQGGGAQEEGRPQRARQVPGRMIEASR